LEKRKRRSINKNIAIYREEIRWEAVGRINYFRILTDRRRADGNRVSNFRGAVLAIRMCAILTEIVIVVHVSAVTRLISKVR